MAKSSLLEKLKKESARLKKEQADRGDYVKVDWFKPQDGENLVRVLPHWSKPQDELFFKQVRLHFINKRKNDGTMINNIPARCLRDLDEECPLCGAYERAVKKLSKDDKAGREKLRRLKPTTRYLYNIIDYKDRKVVPFAAPLTVHNGIMEYAEDFGDEMVDLDKGRDWKIVKKVDPRRPKGVNVEYSVRPGIKESSVPSKLRTLLEGMTDLDTLYTDNMRADMLAFLGVDESDEEDERMDRDDLEADRSLKKAKAAKRAKDEDEEDEDEDEDEKPKFADDEDEEEDDEDDEDEEEDEDEDEEESKKDEDEEEDEEEDDEEEDEDEEEERPAKSSKPTKSSKPSKDEKKKSKKADLDVSDDDLEAELGRMGVR